MLIDFCSAASEVTLQCFEVDTVGYTWSADTMFMFVKQKTTEPLGFPVVF